MKCLDPVRMYRGDNGTVSHVLHKVNSVKDEFFRPCGLCINCRLRRAEGNAIRMVHESKFHDEKCFLTLTYDDSKIPPRSSLRYDDVTKFIKRLRKSLESTKYDKSLSYYRVGEYGGSNHRPHYHMVLFGINFLNLDLKYLGNSNYVKKSALVSDRMYYKSSYVSDCWSHGFVDVGPVDMSTCYYTAKYVTKKLYAKTADYSDWLLPERSSSSKKNPIGKRWIEKYYTDVYPHDYVVLDGKKLQPPRYYDDWLKLNHPSLWSVVSSKRLLSASEITHLDYYDLMAKQTIQLESQKRFTRDGCAPSLHNDEAQLARKRLLLEEIRKGSI